MQGDEIAFTLFFTRYSRKVYSIAYSFTRNKELSEEIVQDIFLNIWLKRGQLQEVTDSAAWLFVLARNRSVNELYKIVAQRNKNKMLERKSQFLPSSVSDSDTRLETNEFRLLLQEAMQLLTPQQHKVFELVKLRGLTRKEAAEKLELSQETVKIHLTHALKIVRAFLTVRLGINIAILLFPHFF